MAEEPMECNPVISKFARFLLKISLQLTPEDLSNIKLLLEVDKILKRRELDTIHNPADLFRLLYSREIIQEQSLGLLTEILGLIDRQDCVKLIQKFNVTLAKGPEVDIECDGHLLKLNKFLQKKMCNETELTESLSSSENSFKKSTIGSNSSDEEKMRFELSDTGALQDILF